MSAEAAVCVEETLTIQSLVLGEVTVPADQVVRFDAGLLGLPQFQSFVLLRTPEEGLYWLQSTEEPGLVFALADPFLYCPGFEVRLREQDLYELGVTAQNEVLVLAVVTLPAAPGGEVTINLQGPLVFHGAGGCAKQVVISFSEYGVRHPIALGR